MEAGKFGVRFFSVTRDFSLFRMVKAGCGAQPASCQIGNEVLFSGINLPGRGAEHSTALVPRLRMHGYISLLPVCALMAWAGTALP